MGLSTAIRLDLLRLSQQQKVHHVGHQEHMGQLSEKKSKSLELRITRLYNRFQEYETDTQLNRLFLSVPSRKIPVLATCLFTTYQLGLPSVPLNPRYLFP